MDAIVPQIQTSTQEGNTFGKIMIMQKPESGQVTHIIINSPRRGVSQLEAHLRGLRQQLDTTIGQFAESCGIPEETYSVLERGGHFSRANAEKVFTRLNDPELVDNPHAEALRILALKRLEKGRKKFSGTYAVPEKYKAMDLPAPATFEGEIIFRGKEIRTITLDPIIENDERTAEAKWQSSLTPSSFGTGARYIRLDRGVSRDVYARALKMYPRRLIAVEENIDLPTPEETETILTTAPFSLDSTPARLLREKSKNLFSPDPATPTHEPNSELLTSLASQTTVGDAFRILREWNNISQRELGSLLSKAKGDANKSAISRIERGAVPLKDYSLVNMLKKFGFDIHHPITHILLGIYDAQEAEAKRRF